MSCRIGMSTDPLERIAHWKAVEGHVDGMVLVSGLTYPEALEQEGYYARLHSCYSHPGGQYQSGRGWSVYRVWGGRVPSQ